MRERVRELRRWSGETMERGSAPADAADDDDVASLRVAGTSKKKKKQNKRKSIIGRDVRSESRRVFLFLGGASVDRSALETPREENGNERNG